MARSPFGSSIAQAAAMIGEFFINDAERKREDALREELRKQMQIDTLLETAAEIDDPKAREGIYNQIQYYKTGQPVAKSTAFAQNTGADVQNQQGKSLVPQVRTTVFDTTPPEQAIADARRQARQEREGRQDARTQSERDFVMMRDDKGYDFNYRQADLNRAHDVLMQNNDQKFITVRDEQGHERTLERDEVLQRYEQQNMRLGSEIRLTEAEYTEKSRAADFYIAQLNDPSLPPERRQQAAQALQSLDLPPSMRWRLDAVDAGLAISDPQALQARQSELQAQINNGELSGVELDAAKQELEALPREIYLRQRQGELGIIEREQIIDVRDYDFTRAKSLNALNDPADLQARIFNAARLGDENTIGQYLNFINNPDIYPEQAAALEAAGITPEALQADLGVATSYRQDSQETLQHNKQVRDLTITQMVSGTVASQSEAYDTIAATFDKAEEVTEDAFTKQQLRMLGPEGINEIKRRVGYADLVESRNRAAAVASQLTSVQPSDVDAWRPVYVDAMVDAGIDQAYAEQLASGYIQAWGRADQEFALEIMKTRQHIATLGAQATSALASANESNVRASLAPSLAAADIRQSDAAAASSFATAENARARTAAIPQELAMERAKTEADVSYRTVMTQGEMQRQEYYDDEQARAQAAHEASVLSTLTNAALGHEELRTAPARETRAQEAHDSQMLTEEAKRNPTPEFDPQAALDQLKHERQALDDSAQALHQLKISEGCIMPTDPWAAAMGPNAGGETCQSLNAASQDVILALTEHGGVRDVVAGNFLTYDVAGMTRTATTDEAHDARVLADALYAAEGKLPGVTPAEGEAMWNEAIARFENSTGLRGNQALNAIWQISGRDPLGQ